MEVLLSRGISFLSANNLCSFDAAGEAIHFFHKELGGWLSNDHLHEHRDERRQRHPLTAKSKGASILPCRVSHCYGPFCLL